MQIIRIKNVIFDKTPFYIDKFESSRTTRGRHGRECSPVRADPPQYLAERYHLLSTNDSSPSVAAAATIAEICYMRFFNNTAF
jgi:hypothetical protein